MAKRSTKKTANRLAYEKELRRIKQFIRRAEQRYYEFDQSKIIPETPKRVTKQAIERLKKLTPEKLYSKAQFLDIETGEIVSGKKGREIERSRAAKKGHETRKRNKRKKDEGPRKEPPPDFFADSVINMFRAHVKRFREEVVNLVFNWLDTLIQKFGKSDVARMLEDGAKAGLILTWEIAYDETKMITYLSRMLDYLPEAGPLFREQMAEAFENMEDYNF